MSLTPSWIAGLVEWLRGLDSVRHIANALGKVASLGAQLYTRLQVVLDIDRASLAHSPEVRVPLVDAQLLRMVPVAVNTLGIGSVWRQQHDK
jgi:hypothetical protein